MSRDTWRTPPEVFAALHAEFDFKLDVAASEHNALVDYYITEGEDCLSTDWLDAEGSGDRGWYAWLNPPYSNIRPFVARASEMATRGVGTVMLVMMDQSVGWYLDAIKTCQEVRLVVGGRLAFLDETGKRVGGNNKGSMFLIWHPYGRTPAVVSHIERDELLERGPNACGLVHRHKQNKRK